MHSQINEIRFNKEKAQCFFSKILAFTVGPVELKNLMDEQKVNIVDVRSPQDYEIAHIPSAISIPENELAEKLDNLSKENVTVVYSYNEHCKLGVRAALTLADYSYPVVLLDGGFKTWSEDFRFTTV